MELPADFRTILPLSMTLTLAASCSVRSPAPAPDAPVPAEAERAQQPPQSAPSGAQPPVQNGGGVSRQAQRPTVWSAAERQAYIEELQRWGYSREFRDGSYQCFRTHPTTREAMPYVCGTILFGLQAGLSARDVADLIRAVSAEIVRDTSDDWGWVSIRVAAGKEKEAVIRLLRDPRVRYAELDFPIKLETPGQVRCSARPLHLTTA